MTLDELKKIKNDFKLQYKNLFTTDNNSGINGIGIGSANVDFDEIGLVVNCLDEETLNKIPDSFMDVKIYKQVIGKIKPL